jgi:hypothetical protein
VNPSNHQRFYDALVRRRERFEHACGVLMRRNAEQCPNFKDGDISLTLIWHSMISNIYTSQMHQRISKPSARGKYSDVLHYIRVYMEQSDYMTILAGQIEAIPYWESILQPVPMQMKDLDAHDREDNHVSSDRPARDHGKKPAGSKPSRDSPQKTSDFFYRKPEAKVSYIDAVDEELCHLAATEQARGEFL